MKFSQRFYVGKRQFFDGILCVFREKITHFRRKRSAEVSGRIDTVLPKELMTVEESLFLIGSNIHAGDGVAGGVDGSLQGVGVYVLLGEDYAGAGGVGGLYLFYGDGFADGVVDVGLAHAAHHAVDV